VLTIAALLILFATLECVMVFYGATWQMRIVLREVAGDPRKPFADPARTLPLGLKFRHHLPILLVPVFVTWIFALVLIARIEGRNQIFYVLAYLSPLAPVLSIAAHLDYRYRRERKMGVDTAVGRPPAVRRAR